MKAILQFDLDEREDKEAHIRATKATDAYLVLWDMMQAFRTVYKYGQDPVAAKYAEEWRDKLIEVMRDHNIDLDNEIS
jgi:hypothetical protein